MRFSDRIGITQPSFKIHIDDMPDTLRTSLWNLFVDLYDVSPKSYWKKIAVYIAKFFRKYPVDELPYQSYDNQQWIKKYFFELSWHYAYNFLEFIVKNHRAVTNEQFGARSYNYHQVDQDRLEEIVNAILERENSGYRFIAHTLSPITTKVEIAEIQRAVTELKGNGLEEAREHINTALDLFSKRPNPDYRNAVKEAISAVESIAKQLGASNGNGLTPALRALSEKVGLHPALQSAFEKLYGYASDEGGIRHAMLEEPTVGFEEAKYMIVACSAFANYLATKSEKAGLLK